MPKRLRDELGLRAGSTLDISRYGDGMHLSPAGRTARLIEENGLLVATAGDPDDSTTITDDDVFGLIDDLRR